MRKKVPAVNKTIAVLLVLALAVTTAGCGPASGRKAVRTITHLDGTTIEVPENARRLAAVYGPSYEALTILGAEDRIVVCADVQFENFPWARQVFKRINDLSYLDNVHTAVNMEQLMSLRPDLAFTFPRPNELRRMTESGIAAIPGVTFKKLSDTPDFLMVYAEALGAREIEAARKYASYFNEKLSMVKAITDKIPQEQRPSVYYAGTDVLTTYGKLCDIPELIAAAGGRAVTAELEAGNRTQINFEQLARWNPDFIFIDHGGINDRSTVEQILENTYSDGRYGVITAVKQKQVYLSPSGVFYWDMGLQKILLLMQMAKILHPFEFAGLDMQREVQEFYAEFLNYELTDEEAQRLLAREDP